ncbi:ribonuclease H-like domain-containing protein [Tanacetum coccineum]
MQFSSTFRNSIPTTSWIYLYRMMTLYITDELAVTKDAPKSNEEHPHIALKTKEIADQWVLRYKKDTKEIPFRLQEIKVGFCLLLMKNGVTERKNRTLIEAVRTMLADSLLPKIFWAEAVNTACYVLNRVLVMKTQNKIPYELINGRTPLLSFMRPFGCLVTILNTLDPLGKFEGKADEGFLVGYSIHIKAFRVYTTRNRHVEENLLVNFLENKPNMQGEGPEWLAHNEVTELNQKKEACDTADVIRRAFEQKCYDQGGAPISSILTHLNMGFQDDMVKGAVADNNNMDTSNVVSSIPTTRVHSFHPKTQIIGDPSSTVQTRSKVHDWSLMYLTASRPDIMFAVCACSRFQVTLKTSHLNEVKRIFRYLKGQPKLGLWYSKESSFDLVAYSDSDYADGTKQNILCQPQPLRSDKLEEAHTAEAKNGNSWVPIPVTTPPESGTSTTTKMIVPATIEEKTCKKNDVKARSLLLMALPNEHQLTFDQLQKLFSRLAIPGVVTPPEDLNVKFLRSLPSEWDTHVVVWMNKPDFDTISASSTNNINIVNPEVSTATTKVNTASTEIYGRDSGKQALMAFSDSEVKIKNLLQKNVSTYKRGLATLEGQIVKYREHEVRFSEEIALLKRSVGSKEYQMGLLRAELEKVKQEKEGFEFKIAKFDKSAKDLSEMLESQITDKSKKGVGYHDVPSPHPLILNRPTPLDLSYSGLEEFKEPEVNEYGPRDSSLKPTIDCDKESDNSKENTDDSLEQHQITDTETSSVKSSLKVDKDWKEKFFYPANHVREVEPKKVRENNDAPIIEDWVSDDEDDDEPNPKVEKKTVIPTATKKEFVKPVKRSVRYAEMYMSQRPRGNQRNWNGQKSNQLGCNFVFNNKACFICGSFDHIQYSCPNQQRKRIVSRNNYNKKDNDHYSKTSHSSAHKHMAPRAVLMKTGLKYVDTARPVNTVRFVNTGRHFSTARSFNTVRPSYTAHPKSTIHCARPRTYFQNQAQSTVHRPFYKRTTLTKRCFNQRFNTGRPFRSTVNTVRARGFNAVKPLACWVWRPIKPNGASLVFNKYNYIDARGRSKSVMAWVPKEN